MGSMANAIASKLVWLKATRFKPQNTFFLHCPTMAKIIDPTKNLFPATASSEPGSDPTQTSYAIFPTTLCKVVTIYGQESML